MYTLILIVVAQAASGSVSVATTHFPVPSKEACDNMAKLLEADSSPMVKIEVHCLAQ